MIRSVYLAYPIDQRGTQASLAYLFDQINVFKSELASHVSWVFDPGDAFRVNPNVEIDPGLATINRAALNNADALVAFLPAGVPTIGVPIEIDRARAQGKAVLVFTEVKSFMLAMNGVYLVRGWDDTALDQGLAFLMEQEAYDPGYDMFGEVAYTGSADLQPIRHHDNDAGFDLITSEDTPLPANSFTDIPCGISVELPERTWAMITGRSSTLRKRGLLVAQGVIDTGYRGPLFAGVWNNNDHDLMAKEGERLAQLILFSNTTMRYNMLNVDELNPSERGSNGFGSTGV